MSTLDEPFERLLGRQPSDREKQALFRVRDALHLKDNDALWLVLMALGHYETLYAQFPALILRAATDMTEKVKATADAELKAAVARTRSELARSLAQTAHEIAEQVASTTRWRTVTWAVVITAAVFVGTGAAMYRTGRAAGIVTGEREGYEKARDERAASAWANTPEGHLGYSLAQAGSLRDLATCSGKAFVRRGTACFIKTGRETIFGWKLLPWRAPYPAVNGESGLSVPVLGYSDCDGLERSNTKIDQAPEPKFRCGVGGQRKRQRSTPRVAWVRARTVDMPPATAKCQACSGTGLVPAEHEPMQRDSSGDTAVTQVAAQSELLPPGASFWLTEEQYEQLLRSSNARLAK